MKLQQLYHGGSIEVRDVAGGGFVVVARDVEAVSLRFERVELAELVQYLNARLRGASAEPTAFDREACAAMEAAAAAERNR